jgi:hypothetical protein
MEEKNETKVLSPEEQRILEERMRMETLRPLRKAHGSGDRCQEICEENVVNLSEQCRQHLNARRTSEETLKGLIVYLGFYLPICETEQEKLFIQKLLTDLKMKKELCWQNIPLVKMALTKVKMKYMDSFTTIESVGGGAREDLSAFYLEKVAGIENLLIII